MSVRAIFRGSTQMGRPSATSAPIRVDPTTKNLVTMPGGPGDTTEYAAPVLEETAGAVTQATSITTGVTLSKRRGIITTVAAPAIAAGAEATFTVTNTFVGANSVPVVAVDDQFSDGLIAAVVSAIGSGSFDITLTNLSAAAVSAGTAKIRFAIL